MHFRIGIPMFDTLGAGHLVTVGYKGTRDLLFALGNMLLHRHHEPDSEGWRDAWPQAAPAASSDPLPPEPEKELVP